MIKTGKTREKAKINKTLTIGLSKDLYDRVEEYCNNNGVRSFSEFYRNAANIYLSKHDK